MATINAKRDQKVTKMAGRAANLESFVTRIAATQDMEAKRLIAYEMADEFQVGGRENFRKSIQDAISPAVIDRIAYNALLKGEGMSSKRF